MAFENGKKIPLQSTDQFVWWALYVVQLFKIFLLDEFAVSR